MIIKGLSRIGVFFLYLISLLPFWLLYLISDVLYLVIYHLVGYRTQVVRTNLANAFPEKTPEERKAIEKKYYHYLGDLIVETIKMLTISEKQVRRRMAPEHGSPDELVADIFKQGQSIIGAVGHYGNWELAALRFSLVTNEERVIVYKPLANKVSDNLFKKVRARFGATLVSMKDVLRKLVALRNIRSFTVLVSDQTPVQESVQYFAHFLNQPTAVFLGIEKLAKMTNSVVVFCDLKCVRRGYYTYNFVPLVTDPKNTTEHEITDIHVAYLENMIKAKPEYWLWSHRRWKFKPANL
jgi:KDO2-lipid IV(A) lauroyltransferase